MAFKLKNWQIWILSVIMVVALGWGLAGNWGNVIGLYYVIGSGIIFGVYHIIKKKKPNNKL